MLKGSHDKLAEQFNYLENGNDYNLEAYKNVCKELEEAKQKNEHVRDMLKRSRRLTKDRIQEVKVLQNSNMKKNKEIDQLTKERDLFEQALYFVGIDAEVLLREELKV